MGDGEGAQAAISFKIQQRRPEPARKPAELICAVDACRRRKTNSFHQLLLPSVNTRRCRLKPKLEGEEKLCSLEEAINSRHSVRCLSVASSCGGGEGWVGEGSGGRGYCVGLFVFPSPAPVPPHANIAAVPYRGPFFFNSAATRLGP